MVQVVNEADGDILYTVREKAGFKPPVYAAGSYTVKFGPDGPGKVLMRGVKVK